MEWAMRSEEFKFSLLRYIDVLPSLKTGGLAVRLLDEYFSGMSPLPPLITRALGRTARTGLMPFAAGLAIRAAAESFASEFIAGKGPEDALHSLESLWNEGSAVTVDLLGEVAVSDRETGQYRDRYLGLLELLPRKVLRWKENPVLDKDEWGPLPRLDISLKISSFYSQIDPADLEGSVGRIKENMLPVLRKAKEEGVSFCLDMEHYYYKDLTIALFRELCEELDHPFAGITLQAYLKDARDDLLGLVAFARETKRRITLRLV